MFAKSRTHLILILTGTALSAFSLGSIIKFTDPFTAGLLTHIFFYASLFMMSLGLLTSTGIVLRQKFTEGLYVSHLSASFRQAFLISLLLNISLLLQARSLLFWWVELTLVLFFLSLEVFLHLK
jgi:hypothetical protein